MKTRVEVSAGGVIYRDGSRGRPEVCLIQTQGGKAWQLPKGIIERGEATAVAAAREVSEETGLSGDLIGSLGRIEYWYVFHNDEGPVRVHKWVYFYLIRYSAGETTDHDDEVDDARWFPLEEAWQRLSFENERNVLERARETIALGAPTEVRR